MDGPLPTFLAPCWFGARAMQLPVPNLGAECLGQIEATFIFDPVIMFAH